MKTEKCIILGKTGSGKDFLSNGLSKLGLKRALKTTTRPMRGGEINGVSYHFINDDEFNNLLECGEFITHQDFKVFDEHGKSFNWHYGLRWSEFMDSSVVILTPFELNIILDKIDPQVRKNLFIVYLDIERETREMRVNMRSNNIDSITRRMDADDRDFEDFEKSGLYDIRIRDIEFNAEDIFGIMS